MLAGAALSAGDARGGVAGPWSRSWRLKTQKKKGIRNLVWVLAPWVFVAITFKEWILVLDG